MYLVLKGFANNEISAVKGKVIKNIDKKLASALIEAGYITPYSKQDMSNKEKDDELKNLNSQLVEKDAEIQTLKDKVEELEKTIEELTAPSVNDDNADNEEDNGDNLDNNTDSKPIEDGENGEESKNNPDEKDDDKSSKSKKE